MTTGLVLGKFYPPHAGHEALIEAAVAGCDRAIVLVAGATVESIPLGLRHRWLAEAHPGADVRAVLDDVPIDMDDPDVWDRHVAVWRTVVPEPIDRVFSSEDYGPELARRLEGEHVAFDPGRTLVPVSGTAVRADPAAHWDLLGPGARAYLTRRVVVVGAASSGTTTLTRALAERHGAAWVPEWGHERSFEKAAEGTLEQWGPEDFVTIAVRQSRLEEEAARCGGPLLLCDGRLRHGRLGGVLPRGLQRGRPSRRRSAPPGRAVPADRPHGRAVRAGRHP